MSRLIDPHLVRRALSAHAAIGLLASALLYIVCVTGTAIVFDQEWQRIEQPRAPEMAAIAPDAVQAGVHATLARERGKPLTTHLYVELPTDALPRTTITTDSGAAHVDAAGRIAVEQHDEWAKFLLALHDSLTLPALWGMMLVGMLGVAMLALSVTGVLAHPRILRDAFRLRARSGGGVGLADWHNRLSVWTLPFGIAIALTGAVVGLGSIAATIAAKLDGSDVGAIYTPIFGGEAKPDPRPAPVADMAAALRTMTARFPDTRPYFVTLHAPATRGQHIQIVAAHPNRLVYGDTYDFDAAGRYRGRTGLSDGTLGQQVAASNYPLHFGNYGGLPVKIVYALFGAALSAVVATGTWIWLGKRRRRGIDEPRLNGAWRGMVWGVPMALVIAFASRVAIGPDAPLAPIFWVGLVIAVPAGVVRQPSRPYTSFTNATPRSVETAVR